MEEWQVKEGGERMHRGTQQDCWGLIHTRRLFSSSIACGNQNIPHGSGDEAKKPKGKACCVCLLLSLPSRRVRWYEDFHPPSSTHTLSSTSRELTDSDWQLLCFWFGCAFIFFPSHVGSCSPVCGFIPLFSHYASVTFPAQTSSYMVVASGIHSTVSMQVWCIH